MVGSTLPTPRSTPAWFCTYCCHVDGCFRFLLCLPSVCSIASYIQYLIHWFLCRTPFTRIPHNLSKYGLFQSLSRYGLFQNPGLHTCFGLNLKPCFEQYQCFCVQTLFYTKSCFTQKLCLLYAKKCSFWACARAVCSLQDSSFHGGRRNTPKAVKYERPDWEKCPHVALKCLRKCSLCVLCSASDIDVLIVRRWSQ